VPGQSSPEWTSASASWPLPLEDGQVVGAVCALALSHLQEIGPAIAELARVVRPGGHLVVSNPHPFATAILGWRAVFVDSDGRRSMIPEYPHRHSHYITAFSDAGFTVRRCIEPPLSGEQARERRSTGLTPLSARWRAFPPSLSGRLSACSRLSISNFLKQLDRRAVIADSGEVATLTSRQNREMYICPLASGLHPQPGERSICGRLVSTISQMLMECRQFALAHVLRDDRVIDDRRQAGRSSGEMSLDPRCSVLPGDQVGPRASTSPAAHPSRPAYKGEPICSQASA
jgi:Methyltransferase domain